MSEQHREQIVTLDAKMVLALSVCPTCSKRPGLQCGDYMDLLLVHGARLNRVWNMAGLGTPFKTNRLYMESRDGNYWLEVEVGSAVATSLHLYVDARLRKHRKPRRRRKG